MDFDLSPEQELLRDNVVRLMKDRYGFEARKTHQAAREGWSNALWGDYAEWASSARPLLKADGGFGGGAVETMIVMEAVRQGAGARALPSDRRPVRRPREARGERQAARRPRRRDRARASSS